MPPIISSASLPSVPPFFSQTGPRYTASPPLFLPALLSHLSSRRNRYSGRNSPLRLPTSEISSPLPPIRTFPLPRFETPPSPETTDAFPTTFLDSIPPPTSQ